MCPCLFLGACGLGEAALLGVAVRQSVSKNYIAAVFFAAIEFSIRPDHGPFLDLLLFGPNGFACLSLLAGQAFAVGIAINVIAYAHHPALMIGHHVSGIGLVHGEFALCAGHFKEIATH